MSANSRGVGAAMLFLATCLAHFLVFLAIFAAFEVAAAPVGAGKREVFAMYVVPVALLMVGWMQGRTPMAVNFVAGVFIWISVLHFPSTYDPGNALGTLVKEQSWDATFSALIAVVICSIVAAVWNAFLRWRGKDVFLKIPFRERIALWPEKA